MAPALVWPQLGSRHTSMDRLLVVTCCLSLWNPRARGTSGAGAPRRQLHTCPSVPEKGDLRRGDRYFQAGAFRAWLGTLCVGLPPAPHRQAAPAVLRQPTSAGWTCSPGSGPLPSLTWGSQLPRILLCPSTF